MNKKYWHLSQSHLNGFIKCPRYFIGSYFQQFNRFPHFEQEDNSQWGSLFHHLKQQQQLDLPLTTILEGKKDLRDSLSALHTAISNSDHNQDVISCEAEVKLQLKWLDKYIFTVVYDQLILKSNQAIIYDWKTYLKPINQEYIINNWQTKLYLFVLTEIMDYAPENVSFIYWFVKLPNTPESYQINYSQGQHEKNKLELDNLLSQFNILVTEKYRDSNCLNYAKCHNQCHYYRQLSCHQEKDSLNSQLFPQSLDEVVEVII